MQSLKLCLLHGLMFVAYAPQCVEGSDASEDCMGSAEFGTAMLQTHRMTTWPHDGHSAALKPASEECPEGSEVFSLAASSSAADKVSFTRVVMADYPSTGSTWLRQMLSAISIAEKLGNPSCSIYPEGECKPDSTNDIQCDCDGFDPQPDAVLFKSHYPAQELYHHGSLNSSQYHATMGFDKILQLVRHPRDTVLSNIHRWGGSLSKQSDNLHCWGLWWERAKEAAGDENVLVVRYEELCGSTAETMHDVCQFLGGRFAAIPLEEIEKTLGDRPDLACLRNSSNETSLAEIGSESTPALPDMSELLYRWGYSTGDASKRPDHDLPMQSDERPPAPMGNPWSEIW